MAVGEKVMVSTQLPIVTEAALEVLREGGNAVDAYITAVFTQTVNDYHQVSLFGMLAGLYYDAPTDTYYTFDAYSERPRADRCGEGDPSKVAIAGKVRGLEALAERFGTREWASYVEPAIASAEEGALVTSFMYANNYNQWENGALIQQNEQAREHYMPEGHLVPVGGSRQRVRRSAGNSWQKSPVSSHRKPSWPGIGGSLRGSGRNERAVRASWSSSPSSSCA